MKKSTAFLLACVFLFGLIGCAQDPAGPEDGEEIVWDLIPQVRIGGVLYFDTGHSHLDLDRREEADGTITSEVSGSEVPTEDDQSNFGTGFAYQYGTREGTVELCLNGKWWIFATEAVRQEIQFPQQQPDGTARITP